MKTVHVVMCTVGDYEDTHMIAVRACNTMDRASQLVGELNGIYEREIESIPRPRTPWYDESYSKEVVAKQREEYHLKVEKAAERVSEIYHNEYGLKIPEYYGVIGIAFGIFHVELED